MSLSVDQFAQHGFGLSVDACAHMFGCLVVQLDEAGRCTAVSQNVSDVLGCSAEEVQGQLLAGLMCPDDPGAVSVRAWLATRIEVAGPLDEADVAFVSPTVGIRRYRVRGAVAGTPETDVSFRWLSIAPSVVSDDHGPQTELAASWNREEDLEVYRVVRRVSHDLNNALTAYHCFWSVVFGDDSDEYSYPVSQLARVFVLIANQARVLSDLCNHLSASVELE